MRLDKYCCGIGLTSILLFVFVFIFSKMSAGVFFDHFVGDNGVTFFSVSMLMLAILTLIVGYIASKRKESEDKYLITGIVLGTIALGLELFTIIFGLFVYFG